MKRIYLAVSIGLLLFLVSGCGNGQNVSLVCGKRFDPAHTVTTANSVKVGDVPMENPVRMDYPNRYYLFVSTQPSDSCDSSRELQVSQSVYDAAKIGSTELTYIR